MHDIPTLVTSGGISYIWLVRDTGTWLIDIDHVGNAVSCELLETVIEYSDEAYWINLEAGTVEQMPHVADGKKYHIENFPCCHITGSVKGMKKYFWGENALLVKCGSYIYNVSGSQYGSFIYYDRAH